MRIIISLLIVSIYWFLDSYQVMQNLNISYMQAIILDYNQSNYFIKFSIAILLFIVSLIPIKTTQLKTTHPPQKNKLCDCRIYCNI